jgi:hypothetical protein
MTRNLRRAPRIVGRLAFSGVRRQFSESSHECVVSGAELRQDRRGAVGGHGHLRGVYNAVLQAVEYHITQYDLEQGALEIQYIEEFFGEFPRKKTAAEIIRRLGARAHLILLASAPLPDDPSSVVPVSFKVAHEIHADETDPKLADLVQRLRGFVHFEGRRVLYTWIGGTRRDWRGQGHFRALTEQQEIWAIAHGFDEIVVKTKNKFYEMRGTLDHLRFEVVKYERNPTDNAESKVYLSKRLLPEIIDRHRSAKTVVQVSG